MLPLLRLLQTDAISQARQAAAALLTKVPMPVPPAISRLFVGAFRLPSQSYCFNTGYKHTGDACPLTNADGMCGVRYSINHSGRSTSRLDLDSEVMGDVAMVPRKWEIVWKRVIIVVLLHIGALYGAYLFLMKAKWQTCLFAIILHHLTMLGVIAGVHRLWCHKSYKATLPLRIILLTMYTLSCQNSVIVWAKNHRTHHKYCDTDADPHNSLRGFFFSHVGWYLVRRHPEVKSKKVDLRDLWADPLLEFQHKYILFLVPFAVITPTCIPVLWGEKAWIAFYVAFNFRFIFTLNMASLINSAAHMWGTQPYDKHIRPVEIKLLSLFTTGEGFHNYHHTFPWDYRAAELGGNSLNYAKLFIEIMAKIGWAYDLKSVPKEVIERQVKRTGDGTHPVWGRDDPALPEEEKTGSKINLRINDTYTKI